MASLRELTRLMFQTALLVIFFFVIV
ncbi:hypothetical protein LINPERPRIM_LOCUS26957 [Linum perenne]